MTARRRSAPPVRARRGCRGGVRAAVVLAGLLGGAPLAAVPVLAPAPLAAQAVEQAQEQRELEYQAALSALESAQAARRALQSRFEQWSDSLNVARIAGDEARRNNAYRELLGVTTDLGSADRRVEQTATALEQARFALKDLIDKRMDLLVDQLQYTSTDNERRTLALVYEDLSNRFEELDREAPPEMQVTPVVLPNIMASPTDGARELSAKAELLERYAARYDTLIGTIEQELSDLEKRAQRDRVMGGFLAGLDRYGDTNLPVGPAREVPPAGSEAGESATPIPLEERMGELRDLLTRYESLREEARERAGHLKQRAQEITE